MGENPKLTVLSEQLRGTLFELADDRYRIGRSDDMEISIVDQTVSGYHCYLERDEEGPLTYVVVDERQSTNGTRINGIKISRQALVNGDILQVGSVECMYESDSEMPPDTTSTNTEIHLDEDVLAVNTRTQNLKPKKWQNDDNSMYLGIKVAIWGLGIVVVGLIGWLVVVLLSAPQA